MTRRLLLIPTLILLLTPTLGLLAPAAHAISFGAFGPNGEGGRVNGQTLTIGATGAVEQLDAFLAIDGQDLNGATPGVAAQLSVDPLPAGLTVEMTPFLSGDSTDLILRYLISNDTGAALDGVTFLSFIDAEIDEPPFFDEFADVTGPLGPGQGWEVDEPGFVFGDLFDNLRDGQLDGTNGVQQSAPDDVAVGLSFLLGKLEQGESGIIDILISEDGDALPGKVVTQGDIDLAPLETITFSGQIVGSVPEPGLAALTGLGLAIAGWCRRRR